MTKLRVGVVGLGSIAQKAYLPFVVHRSDLEIVALVNRSAGRLQDVGRRYRGVSLLKRVEDLLKEKIDAALVHVSTEVHAEVVTELLEAGVDVYVDKPLSYHRREAERIVNVAARRKRVLMVGFNRRFAPLYVRAKAALGSAPVLCLSEKHRAAGPHESATITVYDDMIHAIDLLRFFGGDVEAVAADGRATADGQFLYAALQARAASGGTGIAAMHGASGRDVERVAAYGEGVAIEIQDMTVLRIRRDGREEVVTNGKWDPVSVVRGFEGAIDHFVDCVVHGKTPITSGEEALATQRLAERVAAQFERSSSAGPNLNSV